METLERRAQSRPELIEETVEQRWEKEALHEAIKYLPRMQQRRVRQYYFENLTYEQIAEREGCTKNAIKLCIDCALRDLKNFM